MTHPSGADVIDLDLAVSRDNVLVVSHFASVASDEHYPGEAEGCSVAPIGQGSCPSLHGTRERCSQK